MAVSHSGGELFQISYRLMQYRLDNIAVSGLHSFILSSVSGKFQ
jgi:hypothetical protein